MNRALCGRGVDDTGTGCVIGSLDAVTGCHELCGFARIGCRGLSCSANAW